MLVLGYALVSGVVRRWYVAPALIFVAAGMVLGPQGLDVVKVGPHAEGFTILAQAALTVILFNQAAALDLRTVMRRGHLTVRLLLIGIPVTIGLGTLTAVFALPVLPFWEAVCLAIIVAPTEVALIDALLEERRIPAQIRHALSTESGFYDGFAVAALLAAVALASEHKDHSVGRWAWFGFRTELVSVAVGMGIGLIGASVLSYAGRRGWMNDTWAQLATVALALVCFTAGERLHASGFVSVFAAGLIVATVSARTGGSDPKQVSEATGQLLELLVFVLVGGFAVIQAWRGAGWRVVAFVVVAVFAVRVAATTLALLGSGLSWRSRLFIGWFGPRGIGTLILGLLVLERGAIQEHALITQAAVVTVTLSLLVHSFTTRLGFRLFERELPTQNATPAVSPVCKRRG